MNLSIDPPGYAGTPGVCGVCHGEARTGSQCRSCEQNLTALLMDTPIPVVLPLGLAIKGGGLANTLWRYKRAEDGATRAEAARALRFVIDERLPHVLSHQADHDVICHVPGRNSGGDSVRELYAQTAWGRRQAFRDLLTVQDWQLDTHKPDPRRFVVSLVPCMRILLLDDTFTSGSTSLSGARALFEAGAKDVTIVVVGRHAARDWLSETYLASIEARARRHEFCPACTTKLVQLRPAPNRDHVKRMPDPHHVRRIDPDDPFAGSLFALPEPAPSLPEKPDPQIAADAGSPPSVPRGSPPTDLDLPPTREDGTVRHPAPCTSMATSTTTAVTTNRRRTAYLGTPPHAPAVSRGSWPG